MLITVERRHLWILAVVLLAIVVAFMLNRRQPHFLAPDRVWEAARETGAAHGVDPGLILAIAMAESSFNAHADSGQARGLMQLSPAAWSDTTEHPYHDAFNWRVNMEVAAGFLAYLQQRLKEAGHQDPARLAAAYRHGYAAVASADFDVARLPPPRNEIYQQLFAGNIPSPEALGVTTSGRDVAKGR